MKLALHHSLIFLSALCGCAITGTANLNQDPNTLWSYRALNDDAKVLVWQPYAEQIMGEKDVRDAGLGAGFDASQEACKDLDAAKIPNGLSKLHNALHDPKVEVVDGTWSDASTWVTIPTKEEGLEVSLLSTAIGSTAKLLPPAKVPLKIGVKFEANATSLSLARVVSKVELTAKARQCLVATLCRPQAKGKVPQKVRFVDSVFFGNLIRIRFAEQAFELQAEGTVQGATGKFDTKVSNVSLDAAILGRIDSGDGEGTFDVPEILTMLAEKKLSAIQNEIAERTVNHEIVGMHFAETACPSE